VSTSDALLFGLVPVGLILVGVAVLVYAIRLRKTIADSRTWPTTPGRVVSVDVTQWKRPQGPGFLYAPVIDYEYDVEGQTYRSNVIHARLSATASSLRTMQGAERYGERYSAGSAVTVAYNPADPKTAMLEPGQGGGYVVGIAVTVAAGFLLIGLCFGGGIAIALVAGD
jgi:hypothetical protein